MNKFLLKGGFLRIFLILALIVFVLSMNFKWHDVREKNQSLFHAIRGVEVKARYKKESKKNNIFNTSSDKNNVFDYGYTAIMHGGNATSYCISKAKPCPKYRQLQGTIYLEMLVKDAYELTHTDEFNSCMKEFISWLKQSKSNAVLEAYIFSFRNLIYLYMVMVMTIILAQWVKAGFNDNE